MDEISIEGARPILGEIIDRARLAETPTRITRQGKPAAVIVSAQWYEDAIRFIDRTAEEYAALAEHYDRTDALREGRKAAGLSPRDRRVVHHIDGNPRNNDPGNLEIMDPQS